MTAPTNIAAKPVKPTDAERKILKSCRPRKPGFDGDTIVKTYVDALCQKSAAALKADQLVLAADCLDAEFGAEHMRVYRALPAEFHNTSNYVYVKFSVVKSLSKTTQYSFHIPCAREIPVPAAVTHGMDVHVPTALHPRALAMDERMRAFASHRHDMICQLNGVMAGARNLDELVMMVPGLYETVGMERLMSFWPPPKSRPRLAVVAVTDMQAFISRMNTPPVTPVPADNSAE